MNVPILHHLKCEPAPFEATRAGSKHAEIRKNDRGFQPGDFALLSKWIPSIEPGVDGHYTGENILIRFTHATHGPQHGIAEGYVMLSHEVIAMSGSGMQAVTSNTERL